MLCFVYVCLRGGQQDIQKDPLAPANKKLKLLHGDDGERISLFLEFTDILLFLQLERRRIRLLKITAEMDQTYSLSMPISFMYMSCMLLV